ncbi:AAA family ATPase [Olivibacter sitiensis]|uniref:AAA family ATPase n=1 Tax=Olivibacter sitiensis TaxID=376470 RepID=UPI0003FC5560|nr:ATP-binding protein [Olivibacter sitiensis]
MENLVGRLEEREILEEALKSEAAELIAIYGRRRVGKTFLVKSVYKNRLVFEFSGMHNAGIKKHLQQFALAMQTASASPLPLSAPANWIEAFHLLQQLLEEKLKKQKMVVFIDEFPWLHTPRSGFTQAFGHFWNTWAAWQDKLVVVICGSAASWMIRHVVNDRGGLHNRVTRRIRLLPFTVGETATYLRSQKVNLDPYQILQLYMCMGGIPHYLKSVQAASSSAQVIDKCCFTKNGPLRDEFTLLYQSLFDHAEHHLQVVRALAQKSRGMTRNEIIKAIGLTTGGGLTKILNELEESGFISGYIPFEKTAKDSLYKLTDEYSLFYLKFIEHARATGEGTWIKLSQGSSWKAWSGYAYENICMKHAAQLKRALGIGDVYTEVSPWRYRAKEEEQGVQVDLLFDRQDKCINLCEIKFYNGAFAIDKAYADKLKQKLRIFREKTKTRKTVFLTLITTHGLKQNTYSLELVQKELTMKALFD